MTSAHRLHFIAGSGNISRQRSSRFESFVFARALAPRAMHPAFPAVSHFLARLARQSAHLVRDWGSQKQQNRKSDDEEETRLCPSRVRRRDRLLSNQRAGASSPTPSPFHPPHGAQASPRRACPSQGTPPSWRAPP